MIFFRKPVPTFRDHALVVLANSTHTLRARRRWRVVNAKESFDASNHAADWSGDNGTDRAGDAIAFIGAVRKAPWKSPLSLSRDRCREGRNDGACIQY